MIESVQEGIVGTSAECDSLRQFVRSTARSDDPVLLLGEPGVGKETVARGIHAESCRSEEPFLMIDCSLYYERELRREIFGFRGVGSDANSRRGVLDFASKGTCYLSRVEELTMELQKKIFEFIATGKFCRLGDGREVTSGARLVLSSDKNLRGFVEGGLFDAKLFEAVSENMTSIAPLRERSGDIEEIVRSLAEESQQKTGRKTEFSAESLEALRAFPWPRNIDELEKELRRTFESGVEMVRVEDLSFEISSFWRGQCEDPEVRRVVEELDGYIREFRVLSRLDAEFGEILDDVIDWGGLGGGRRKKKPAEPD